jgi:hypothetical protein
MSGLINNLRVFVKSVINDPNITLTTVAKTAIMYFLLGRVCYLILGIYGFMVFQLVYTIVMILKASTLIQDINKCNEKCINDNISTIHKFYEFIEVSNERYRLLENLSLLNGKKLMECNKVCLEKQLKIDDLEKQIADLSGTWDTLEDKDTKIDRLENENDELANFCEEYEITIANQNDKIKRLLRGKQSK